MKPMTMREQVRAAITRTLTAHAVADAATLAADIEQALYKSGLSAADDSQSSPTLYCDFDHATTNKDKDTDHDDD